MTNYTTLVAQLKRSGQVEIPSAGQVCRGLTSCDACKKDADKTRYMPISAVGLYLDLVQNESLVAFLRNLSLDICGVGDPTCIFIGASRTSSKL